MCNAFLIEPIPHLFKKLQNNYSNKLNNRINLIQCAISETTGIMPIYKFKTDSLKHLPYFADQLASFDITHLLNHLPEKVKSDEMIESIETKTYKFEDFIKKYHINSTDICIIDTEGHEKQIIENIPFDTISPDILIFEMLHLSLESKKSIYEILTRQSYILFSFPLDTIAIKKSLRLNWKKHYLSVDSI